MSLILIKWKVKIRQVVNSLKSLENWDFKKAIMNSNDEATTRAFLIHPF